MLWFHFSYSVQHNLTSGFCFVLNTVNFMPPGPLPLSKIPFVRLFWSWFHTFSTKWHPSYAHLKFEITFFEKSLFPFCHIIPAPRPHGPPPKRCSRSRWCRSTKFHPDWTKWRASYACLKFQILRFRWGNHGDGGAGNTRGRTPVPYL